MSIGKTFHDAEFKQKLDGNSVNGRRCRNAVAQIYPLYKKVISFFLVHGKIV